MAQITALTTGGAYLGEELHRQGIDTVFGVMGEANIDLVSRLVHLHGARYIAARHEAGAVAMADGASRASGEIGVATVTYGPGLANALTALVSAVRHRSKLLLVTGQKTFPRSNQRFDQATLLKSTGATTLLIEREEDLVGSVGRALALIRTRNLPVVLYCVDTILENPISPSIWSQLGDRNAPADDLPADPGQAAALELARAQHRQIEAFAGELARAERPLIVAGAGARSDDARRQLEALAERTNAALMTSLLAKGLFGKHPRHLGVAGGFTTERGLSVMQAADLVAVFGASFNVWTTRAGTGFPNARILQCDLDPSAFGRATIKADLTVVGDASTVGRQVGSAVERLGGPANRTPWWPAEFEPGSEPIMSGNGVHPRELCRLLERMLPADRTVVVDGGHHFEFSSSEISVPDRNGFMWTVGFGAIGLGIPTALGAAVGRPDRLTVLFSGDGGLFMCLQELETAARARIPVLIFVMNDEAYGSEVRFLEHKGLPTELARFSSPSVTSVADALGLRTFRLHEESDLALLADNIAGVDGPTLCDVRIDGTIVAHWIKLQEQMDAR